MTKRLGHEKREFYTFPLCATVSPRRLQMFHSTPAANDQLSGMKGPNPVKSIIIKTYTAVTSILSRAPWRDDAQSGDSADGRLKRRGGVNLCSTSGQTLHGEFAEKELTQEKKNAIPRKHPEWAQPVCGHINTQNVRVRVSV